MKRLNNLLLFFIKWLIIHLLCWQSSFYVSYDLQPPTHKEVYFCKSKRKVKKFCASSCANWTQRTIFWQYEWLSLKRKIFTWIDCQGRTELQCFRRGYLKKHSPVKKQRRYLNLKLLRIIWVCRHRIGEYKDKTIFNFGYTVQGLTIAVWLIMESADDWSLIF